LHNVECNTFLAEISTDVFFYSITRISFYSRQGIDVDKVMESNNLLIGHKHGKEIYMIEIFLTSDYGRELSHVCGYTWTLDLMWVRKGLFLGALHSKI
jgi:hypothetical protein